MLRRSEQSLRTFRGLMNYCTSNNAGDSILYHKIVGKKEDASSSVMILHGLFGSTPNWGYVSNEISKQKLFDQVVLVDLRNHGKSFHHPEFNISVMSDDIERLINHLSLPKDFTLMGHSLGGKVAMDFALQGRMDESSKLIVVDIAPIHYHTNKSFGKIVSALMDLNISTGRTRKDIEADFEKLLPEEGSMVRAFLLTNLEQTSDKQYKWRVNLDAVCKSLESIGEVPTSSKGKKSNVKTLFIGGENSEYIPKDSSETLRSYFPNSQVKYIENAGHWVHYENPKEFLRTLTDFRKQ